MLERKKNAIPKPTNFGGNLRLIRKMQGMSQTGLANEIGVTRNKIASYESGMVEPSAKVFLMVCHYFEQNPKDMLGSSMADNPLSTVVEISDDIDIVDRVMIDQLDGFIAQTNDMAKILEGYRSLNDMRQEKDEDATNDTLYSTFDDLLDLLDNLLKANWKLINTLTPIDNVE